MKAIKKYPGAYIKHQLPGRVRLKIPQKRGDFDYFERLAELFSDCPGITQLQFNPPAASLLICHGAETQFLHIAEFAHTNGLFTLIDPPEEIITIPHLPLARLTADGLGNMDELLMGFSRGRLDSRTLLIMALIGLAVRQGSRGNIMGAASSLIWYAFRLLKEESEKTFDLSKYDDPL
ncbi:MAG: hypothetical protein NTX38_15390 [Methylobacter sp.]|nr:hypothetical protein [Methylobacter sp.]